LDLPSLSKFLEPRRRPLWLALLIFVVLAPLSFLKLGQTLDNLALDLCYRLRPTAPPPPGLLIVGIDEPSFQELRLAWPWPRSLHATLIDRLAAAGARLIVFDILFADPTTQEDDQLLAGALHRAGNVVLAETLEITQDPHFSRQILVQPLEALRREARALGLIMITPDSDGVVRRFHLRLGGQETLPLVVAQSLWPPVAVPPDLSGLIYYSGPPRSIDIVSYYQVLDPERPLPDERLRGRIVLVGRLLEASITPQSQADSFYTPFFAATGQLMSGAEVQAHIINTVLSGLWGQEVPWALRLGAALALMLIYAYLLTRLRPLAALITLAGLIVLALGVSLYLFLNWRLWMSPILAGLGMTLVYTGNILGHYLVESREKRWLRQAFGRYVSPGLVEVITTNPDRLELGGEEVEASILFADLAGFTRLSEDMAPKPLIHLLNEYFTAFTEIILAHQGTLDKYIGDALMAYWGAPIPQEDHALRGCRAALEMVQAMEALQEAWVARGLPVVSARMGLHSGRVIAGNVGSRERFNYTVMGDAVNLAFRLEGANRHYGTRILISEATQRRVSDAFLLRELDQVQVKGRMQPVTIFELLGPAPGDGAPDWLKLFASGRAAYREGLWQQAANYFQEVLRRKEDDGPARLFLHRCREFVKNPPPPNWHGVFILERK
jgi:adenylate cyclase